jgi:hypothetical protein
VKEDDQGIENPVDSILVQSIEFRARAESASAIGLHSTGAEESVDHVGNRKRIKALWDDANFAESD